jgi:hypothetical protein
MDDLVFWLYWMPGWWNLGGFVGYMLTAQPFTAKDIVVDCLMPGRNLYLALKDILCVLQRLIGLLYR